jgi:nitroreductase
MEAEQAIRTRRSIRVFEDESISREDIEGILEAGRWAPSGLNNQPWKLVIVEDREKAREISAYTRYNSIVENAPLLIAVFLDIDTSYDRDKDIMAIGAFIQNVLLAIHARGLGAVWLGEILNKKDMVREALHVPKEYELMAVIAVGRPGEEPEEKPRKPLTDLILHRF